MAAGGLSRLDRQGGRWLRRHVVWSSAMTSLPGRHRRVYEAKLERAGIATFAQLAASDEATLQK